MIMSKAIFSKMTLIFEIVLSLAVGVSFSLAHASSALQPAAPVEDDSAEAYEIIALELTGLHRTNREWLKSYIDITFPARLTRDDAKRFQRRLLTTAVFSQVRVLFVPVQGQTDKYHLHIDVVERWTMIPVIRAVYGGGTPLRVFGLYDIHVLGRLLTVGGEGQKYGDAPTGSVFYIKSPRHDAGRYFLASEFWREYRRRPVYTAANRAQRKVRDVGVLSTNVSMGRMIFLRPAVYELAASSNWRIGGELMWFQERSPVYESIANRSEDGVPDIARPGQDSRTIRMLPTLMYDDIDLNILDYDGLRVTAKIGPSPVTYDDNATKWHSFSELELFWFKLLPSHWNLGLRAVAGGSSYDSVRNQYFLGGLDTVRGFPDGLMHGSHASFINLELRHLTWKPTAYTWIQSVGFCDYGAAGYAWHQLGLNPHAACGVGARLAVPQVNRLIFRLDYAWAVDGSGYQGIAAGMNQFFDPFKPLSDR